MICSPSNQLFHLILWPFLVIEPLLLFLVNKFIRNFTWTRSEPWWFALVVPLPAFFPWGLPFLPSLFMQDHLLSIFLLVVSHLSLAFCCTDTIFVRVYESRMDLLRAVIVGAEGTPYHDGLFFFDIFFPAGYPSVPPVFYAS